MTRIARIAALKIARQGVQLHFKELAVIARTIQKQPGGNLLVFGVGHDSPFWMRINQGGRTVFLEDDACWLDRIRQRVPAIEAYKVEYGTTMSEWRSYLYRPDRLAMTLPQEIEHIQWDVILVDGPVGYIDYVSLQGVEAPGRMKSIFMAAQLVRNGGSVFVHDCEREIERAFCDRYLQVKDCVAELEGRALLRHYVVRR